MKREETMAQEYGKFECRVCGKEVFILLPVSPFEGQSDGGLHEVTCPKGHTDAYHASEMKTIQMKPLDVLRARAAPGGVG